MTEYTLSQWVTFFYIYCFMGWIWESAYVSIRKKRLVNRGFLKGPFLPIYGSGAICMLVIATPFRENVFVLFVVGMVSATVLEYVTGYLMERIFRVRYWDYTGQFLNLNGYICLSSTICWGGMTVVLVEFLQEFVEKAVLMVNETYLSWAVMVSIPLFTYDFMTSFGAAIQLRNLLVQKERVYAELKKLIEKKNVLEKALQSAGGKAKEQMIQELKELYMKLGAQKERMQIAYAKSIKGLLKRNPTAVSKGYRESFAELKQSLMDKIGEMRNPEE